MAGTVLCVEEDRNLCQILAVALGGERYRVLTAFDGEEALAVMAEDPPDLVLLDVVPRLQEELAVLRTIRGLPEPHGNVPVVLLSGGPPTADFLRRALGLGANDVLSKPVPLARLLSVIACQMEGLKEPIPISSPHATEGALARRPAAGLAGSLERLSFAALLHHLHGLRADGVLHLVNRRKRKWIQFRDGYPVAVRGNLVDETLGNMLVRNGRVSPAAAAESRRRMGNGQLQGEILVAMEALTEPEMSLALRAQAEQKLFEIFSWETGIFRYEMGAHLQRANALPVDQSPANLILTGVRKRLASETLMAFFRTSANLLIAPAESSFYRFQDVELGVEQQSLLRRLDGTVRLGEFARSEDSVQRTLYGLVAAGLLELRRGKPVKERAIRRRPPRSRGGGDVGPSSGQSDDAALSAEFAAMLERFTDQDHFEILGVGKDACADEIHHAYGRLAERAHPDRVTRASTTVKRLAEQVFSLVERAHEVLGDNRERQTYLLELRRSRRDAEEREAARLALDAETQFQQGEAALRGRNVEQALLCFGKALELYPEEGEYHAHYGYALHLCYPENETMALEAIEHVKRGLKLAGHREKPYLFMGRLCKATGRIEVAEKMFNRAVQIQPDCTEALSELRLIETRRLKAKGLIGRLFRR